MNRSGAIRILIADDHDVVREGLAAIINRQPDMVVVAAASNGREAIELFQAHGPEIILLDLRMPVLDGLGALNAIREADPAARIIMLTTFDDDEDIYRCLRAGAKGYLLKESAREDLYACIRSVHAGKTCVSAVIASKLAERMSSSELTPRELEVLRLMADGRTNREIATILSVTEGTVKVHVNSVLTKMNVDSRTEAATTAVKRGLIRL